MGYLIQRQIRTHLRTDWPKLTHGDTAELMVLYTLADHANENRTEDGATVDNPGGTRTCHPSIETIVSQGVASKRHVQRALAGLRAKGYITVTPHPRFSTNQFTVTDMVAGNALLNLATGNAVQQIATQLDMREADARDHFTTMVNAFEQSYALSHDGCDPTPQVVAEAIHHLTVAVIAASQTPTLHPESHTSAQPHTGDVPHLRAVPQSA